mmetsp:Transcript_3613/g.5345  ORF Transcript_3613/g.5345 Transcript_3613/m.5345 type:complete len:366 (+) Transcript_3613:371-1468(+)|eukprot:CAMPEP_0175094660 /NCGR_PEP_ID=MMETSP0086_2-20121207/3716_1 /TAXON_ID=136419 /ORGANISM="Unknown Unknown, Strain D1" /LENGTH=365 /DNA_ID=CAMNT_0016367807 /DNA_START=145 /DNA_END=1242 /DNA_ORIENTATION=+
MVDSQTSEISPGSSHNVLEPDSDAKTDEQTASKSGEVPVYMISTDLETTGLTSQDAICQIAFYVERAFVRADHQSERDSSEPCLPLQSPDLHWDTVLEFEELVDPKTPMSKGAAEVTGITDDQLVGKRSLPAVMEDVVARLNSTCSGGVRILTAYNGMRFDFKMLFNDLAKKLNGTSQPDPMSFIQRLRIDWLCDPFILAKRALDQKNLIHNDSGRCSFRLGDVYLSMFKEKLPGWHGALPDSRATLRVLKHTYFGNHFTSLLSGVVTPGFQVGERADFLKPPGQYFAAFAKGSQQSVRPPSILQRLSKKLEKARSQKRKAPEESKADEPGAKLLRVLSGFHQKENSNDSPEAKALVDDSKGLVN